MHQSAGRQQRHRQQQRSTAHLVRTRLVDALRTPRVGTVAGLHQIGVVWRAAASGGWQQRKCGGSKEAAAAAAEVPEPLAGPQAPPPAYNGVGAPHRLLGHSHGGV